MIQSIDVKVTKGVQKNISMKKYLMRHVERAAVIVNLTHLVVNHWKPQKSIGLYNAANYLFV